LDTKDDLVEDGILDVPPIISTDEIEFLLSWSMNLLSQHVQDVDEKLMKETFVRTFPPILKEKEEETLLPHLNLKDVLPAEDPDLDLLQESIERLFFDLPEELQLPPDETFTPPPPTSPSPIPLPPPSSPLLPPPTPPSSPPRKRRIRYAPRAKKRGRGRPRKPRAFESNNYVEPTGQTLLESYFQT
jgi:hypothetical protein